MVLHLAWNISRNQNYFPNWRIKNNLFVFEGFLDTERILHFKSCSLVCFDAKTGGFSRKPFRKHHVSFGPGVTDRKKPTIMSNVFPE